MTDRKYEIGYGKPPKEYRFKLGQSGNPNGRPKKAANQKSLADRLNKIVSRKVSIRVGEQHEEHELLDAMLLALAHKAGKGDIRSINLVRDILEKAETPPAFEILPEDEAELERELLKLMSKGA